jgi:hypothetical protein
MLRDERDELLDAMIGIAARRSIAREAAGYAEDEESGCHFSPQFERKMRRLMSAPRHRGTRRMVFRTLRVILVCIAAMSLFFMSAFAFFPEFRNTIINTIIEWIGVSADLFFPGIDATEIEDPTIYIPDEFKETARWELDSFLEITYTNAHGDEIQVTSLPVDGAMLSVDIEYSTHSIVRLHGMEIQLFTSNVEDRPSNLVFHHGTQAYFFSGAIDPSELIRMAESFIEKKIKEEG